MMDRQLSVAQYSIVMCLKSFLKFCRSVLAVTCLDPSELQLPKRRAPNVEFLTNEEIQKVLDAINVSTFTGVRLRALVELLLATGMRICGFFVGRILRSDGVVHNPNGTRTEATFSA